MARQARAGRESGGGVVWMQGLACGAGVVMAPAASSLIAVLLLPAILALMLDRSPGRPLARAVLLCGSAACVGPVVSFWQMGGHEFGVGLALLGDSRTLGTAWAAGAGGWLLTQILPIGVRGLLEASSLARGVQLRAERERLLRAWDLKDF